MKNKARHKRDIKSRKKWSRRAEVASRQQREEDAEEISKRVWAGTASVYRFFSQASHADEMCKGTFLVSTLEACRGYEDVRRGDKGEGELIYCLSGTGHGSDRNFVEMAARGGFLIDPSCRNVSFSGVNRVARISDGFVVCTTLSYSPEHMSDHYGKYCVEIHNVRRFAELIDVEINKLGAPVGTGIAGPVRYSARHYAGLSPPPGPIGFVKPKDQYSADKEYRLLWPLQGNAAIKPEIIHIAGLAETCRRIR